MPGEPQRDSAELAELSAIIQAVRDRSHWNTPNIKGRHPVALGLCTLEELEVAVRRANRGKKTAAGDPVEVTVAAPSFENEDSPAG